MRKEDITGYSDSELSLLVFNTEELYLNRRLPDFKEYLKEYFVFTDDQWDNLELDLNEDFDERNS